MTTPHIPAPHSPAHRALEGFGIVAAYALVALVIAKAIRAVDGAGDIAILVAALGAGYVLADFFSGMIHFTFDRFFTTATPFLGPAFVSPFRIHHEDPEDITRHGFLETNGNCCLATLPALAPLALAPIDLSNGVALFLVTTLTVSAVATFLTNQIHKWAHSERPGAVVAWLQRHNLILPPDHHKIHHTFPHETHYCITTGWLNAPLAGMWGRIERVARLFGATVHKDVIPEPIAKP